MTYSKYWFGAEENHMVKEGVAGAEGSWGACSLLPLCVRILFLNDYQTNLTPQV